MKNEEFIQKAKELVEGYTKELHEMSDEEATFQVYVVWNCYILGNQKALISTTLHDGMYYEVTYNAAKNEIYFDAYEKVENRCVGC